MTQSNVAMGTPDFIAPEALIAGMKVDQRADIYALGVMLYQVLTGMVPRGRFALPSGVVPQLGKGFDAIVDKAMQTDREQRYSTATEVKQALEYVATKPAVTAASAVPVQKSRLRWYAAAASFLGLAGAGLWWLPSSPDQPQTVLKLIGYEAEAPKNKTTPPLVTAQGPGLWQQHYTRLEQLKPLYQNPSLLVGKAEYTERINADPRKAVRLENGWLESADLQIKLPLPLYKNMGVRVTSRLGPSQSMDDTSAIYLRSNGNKGCYGANWRGIVLYPGPGGTAQRVYLQENVRPVQSGEEFSLEFYVIGSRLITRYNGATGEAEDGECTFPSAHLILDGSIKDVEVINLDGLSEAEALKLVGVSP